MKCSCGQVAVTNEFLCKSCLDKEAEALLSYQQSLKSQKLDEVEQDVQLRWQQFILTHPNLSSYIDIDMSPILKNVEFKTLAVNYCKNFTVHDNNQGIGIRFIGDYSTDVRLFALYILRRLLRKYISKEHGLVSIDYTNMQDIISDVFLSPADNFYSTSSLLVLDGVDLPLLLESKMESKAFYSFVKYRLDQSRPTFMIIHNSSNKLPDHFKGYMQNAFQKNTILLKDFNNE